MLRSDIVFPPHATVSRWSRRVEKEFALSVSACRRKDSAVWKGAALALISRSRIFLTWRVRPENVEAGGSRELANAMFLLALGSVIPFSRNRKTKHAMSRSREPPV